MSTPINTPPTHLLGVLELSPGMPMFFLHIAKQVGRKPFYLGLKISKSLVDQWCSGEKRDVFTAAKKACAIVREERRGDLIPAILAYIAGADDCAVLNAEQTEALRVLAKAIR
jgi:hypothetical protein